MNIISEIKAKKYTAGMQEAHALLYLQLNVRRLREQCGISQRELARRCSTSHPSIVRIENGSGGAPTITTLAKLGEALGVTIADLISEPRANYTPTYVHHVHQSKWGNIPTLTTNKGGL